MTKHLIVLITTMLMLWLTPAMAQSAIERNACHRDAMRWCKQSVASGDMTLIRGCFAAHKSLLTTKCRAVLSSYGM